MELSRISICLIHRAGVDKEIDSPGPGDHSKKIWITQIDLVNLIEFFLNDLPDRYSRFPYQLRQREPHIHIKIFIL